MFAEITAFQATLGTALLMIVAGLLICLLSSHGRYEILKTIFFWVGLIVAVLGLILFMIKPLIWVGRQLTDAIGA
jgi:hypothetical protein